MKKLIVAPMLILGSFVTLPAYATTHSTKIDFAKNSACGSFSGDIQEGKKFRIWLQPNQKLVIRNLGDDKIKVAYVSGPSGRLDSKDAENATAYHTKSKGNHYMQVYGTSQNSQIEFCAY